MPKFSMVLRVITLDGEFFGAASVPGDLISRGAVASKIDMFEFGSPVACQA